MRHSREALEALGAVRGKQICVHSSGLAGDAKVVCLLVPPTVKKGW